MSVPELGRAYGRTDEKGNREARFEASWGGS